jgi:hypothetical protein
LADRLVVDSELKCNAPVEGDFDVEAELLQEGLSRGFEAEAFAWCEVGDGVGPA